MTKVACIGEAMIELSLSGDVADVGVAGDTLNTAVYLKRAAPAFHVDYMTRVGDDPFSDKILDFIAAQGLGTGQIVRDAGKSPGLYAITTAADGERSFIYWREASAARDLFHDHAFDVLASYDAVLLTGITMAILQPDVRAALFTFLESCDTTVIYDSNHRPRLWSSEETARQTNQRMWSLADIALPSIDDEMAIFGETAAEVERRFGLMQAVGALKRGHEGPISIGQTVSQTYPPADHVVDTTAAGDSFNGCYVAARLSGKSQAEALMAGHMCARAVVGQKGAIVKPAA